MSSCCILLLLLGLGPTLALTLYNNTQLTLTVPSEAYPGDIIDLHCESSTPGLYYRWVDSLTMDTLSETQQYSLPLPLDTNVTTRMFTCQVSATFNGTIIANETSLVDIAFVNSVTFDVRYQDTVIVDEITIQCFASTTVSRAAVLSWFFNSVADRVQIGVTSTGYQVVDRTLTILGTDPARSGVYECSATLDDVASTTKSSSTTIQIYSPPVVSLELPYNHDVFSPLQYSLFQITCDVTGLETPTIEWLVNGLPPDLTLVDVSSNITQVDINSQNVYTSVSEIHSILTIRSVLTTLASVSCLATGTLGSDAAERDVRVGLVGRPCAPVGLMEVECGSYCSELTWSLDTECEARFLFASSYILQYHTGGIIRKFEYLLGLEEIGNLQYSYIFPNLTPNTAYQIRVSAKNEYGTSEYTEYISVVTSPVDKKVMFYYGAENGDSEMEHGYYSQSPALKAAASIPVGSRRIESVYVSPFGVLSLGRRSYSWYPRLFLPNSGIQHLYLLAPFWSDIDYSVEGTISYRVYQSGSDPVHNSVVDEATQLSITHAGADTTFRALAVIVATWAQVEPWGYEKVYAGVNTFQAAIVTDYESSYVLFGYTCGELSWSSSATYPTSPVIGFGAGGTLSTNHHLSYSKDSHNIGCLLQETNDATVPVIVGYTISVSTADSNEKCIEWLSNDIKINSGLPTLSFGVDNCPCVLFQARRDSRYRFDHVAYYSGIYEQDVTCYISRFSTNGLYQRCCYDRSPNSVFAVFLSSLELTPIIKSGKQRGSILTTNPVYHPDALYQLYRERDEEGHVQCCLLSDKCDVFYRRRPSQDCTGYVFRPFTWGFGDPHVISMDGFMYTFNGIGEYWYLFPVGQCDFEVQARTQPIKDSEATVFTSIAVRINNCSTVFVSLLGREDLSLFVDQQNRTDDIHSSGVISNDCINIEYLERNITQKSKIDVAYRNGAFIRLQAENELISISVSLPDNCRGRTSGLIGQWDDDVSNDLLMRNGTLLSQSVTDREKEEFADSWKITQEESFMVYETGDHSTYNPLYTLSLYLDEFLQDANISTEIITLCDGNQVCLFDAAVTNDTSIAAGSLLVTNEAEEAVIVGNSVPPLIQSPLLLLLSLDNLTTLEFNVTDEDTFSVSYSLYPLSVFSQVQLHNLTLSLYQLHVRLIEIPDSMNVTIIANDSIGVSLVSVTVFVCGCDNGGYCSDSPSATDSVGDSGYIRSSCQCPVGYEGVYCSDAVTDPCLQSVCEIESCPSGTVKDFSRCVDIDECILLCNLSHQICANTYGSYLCTCKLGYQLVEEECIDVDECALPISPCQQRCTNNNGSYTCDCDIEYVLEVDQSTCRGISNTEVCGTNPLYNCEEDSCIYVEGKKVCSYCKKGTELSADGRFCDDIHECTLQPDICPVVSSQCYDEFSTYYCVCNPGYAQDSENNCVDVDECQNSDSVCDSSQICFNTEGSFICAAYCYPPLSYILPSGDCAAADGIITRTPDSSETLTVTFNLSFEELEQNLDARGLTLSSLYSALNDSLHTPLQDIQISRYMTTGGKLQLVLLSDNFQVDPSFLIGTLRTSLLYKWAPYVAYVTQVSANTVSTVQPTDRLLLSTLLIIALCGGSFLVLLLLGLSCVWVFSARKFSCPSYGWKDKDDSIQEELLSELKKLKQKRAIGAHTVDPIKTDFPNWPRGIIKSNPLTCYPLSYMLSEDPPMKIYEEFDGINMHLATVEDIPPACEDMNRFRNILPPPHSRVPLFLKYGLPNSDYINANFIRGYNMVPRMYIATQAPMFSTEQDFWRMVWEQKVKIIIMLTEMVERSREKCIPYWPDKDILTSIRFGDIEIISRSKIVREDYQINEFILKHLHVNEVQEVTHYWYRKWPEYGVPSNPNSLVTLLLETRGDSRTSSHPVLVHCASGTGRTGVVLAVDIGMHELEEKHSVDILRTVSVLRQDRGGLIQTREQYHFLYNTLCAYARYIDTQGGEKSVL